MISLSDMRQGRSQCRLPGVFNVCLLNSGSKYLQNSSRMQKISIKSVDVIGSEFYLYYFDFQL